MKYSTVIFLFLFCSSVFGQNNKKISKKEYCVYNFLIKNLASSSNLIINDSTINKDLSPLSTDQFQQHVDVKFISKFQNVNSLKFKVEKKRLCSLKNIKSETKECYFEFSRCLIEGDTLAMVYVGVQYGSLNGEGNIYILKRKSVKDNWYIEEKVMRWKS